MIEQGIKVRGSLIEMSHGERVIYIKKGKSNLHSKRSLLDSVLKPTFQTKKKSPLGVFEPNLLILNLKLDIHYRKKLAHLAH